MPLQTPQNLFPGLADVFAGWTAAMPALVEPMPNQPLLAELPGFVQSMESLVPRASRDTRGCLRAALHLLADDLSTAHTLCQDIATPQGSAWHAIVHRREGDFWNSNYWWRRASAIRWSPITPAGELASPEPAPHLPSRFVDRVEQLLRRGPTADAAETQHLLDLQRWEWAILFLQGFSDALAAK
jgi:hypothetical protein